MNIESFDSSPAALTSLPCISWVLDTSVNNQPVAASPSVRLRWDMPPSKNSEISGRPPKPAGARSLGRTP